MDPPQQQRATPSLVHLTLKATASKWRLFDTGDIPKLAGLPLQLRLALDAYLDYHGAAVCVAARDVLTSGSETMPYLNLAGVVGQGSRAVSLFLDPRAQLMESASAASQLSIRPPLQEMPTDEAGVLAVLAARPARIFVMPRLDEFEEAAEDYEPVDPDEGQMEI